MCEYAAKAKKRRNREDYLRGIIANMASPFFFQDVLNAVDICTEDDIRMVRSLLREMCETGYLSSFQGKFFVSARVGSYAAG